MNVSFMRFPEGKAKALTLSYDDGVDQDIRFIETINKYGLKCTFNINSGIFAAEDKVYKEGTIHRRMPESKIVELYTNSGHEVAVHASTHPWLETLPSHMVAKEIIEDRIKLEKLFKVPVRGMAYPYGTTSDSVVEILKSCGIVYSRTIEATKKFDLPTNWLRLPSTCHHCHPELMQLAKKFVEMETPNHSKLFYLWGHTYEFEAKDNWNVIEEFGEYIGGREDIWYATNIEIYEYIEAYNRLIWSADMSFVKNPTTTTLWVKAAKHPNPAETIKIEPGETVWL